MASPFETLAPHIPGAVKDELARGRRAANPAPRRVAVFLAYSTDNQPRVLEIQKYLAGLGHDVWMDVYRLKRSERTGMFEHLDEKIFPALRECGYRVACLSAACHDPGRYVFRELAEALTRASSSRYLYLVPLLLDGTEP